MVCFVHRGPMPKPVSYKWALKGGGANANRTGGGEGGGGPVGFRAEGWL